MAKKRKLESNAEAAASPEPDSINEEHATTLPGEAPAEVSSVPATEQPVENDSLVQKESKPESVETSDPVPVPFVSGEIPTTEVAVAVAAAVAEEDEENENDPVILQKLLEPFSKEQLLSLLHDAALKHPDLWGSIRQTADVDPAHRKVFVHGLAWNTTAETLTSIFRQYGEIEDCKSVVDKITGKSKGYGFILFKHRSGARRALKEPQKKIGNRMAACQLASTGPVPAPPPVLPMSEYTLRKIYVSNVGPDIDPQKILHFFAKFGEIEDGPLGLDKATGKPKGFCLFVYKSPDSAKKALEEPHKNFEGHILHVQKAVDGPKPNKQGLYHSQGGGLYAGQHQGSGGFGGRGPQIGRSGGAVLMGGQSSSIGGPGHLIAPPANMVFNQSGLAINNGVHALKSTFGHQVSVAGSYPKQGPMGGYVVPQVQVNYGGAAIGQGSVRPQQGLGHMGGVGPYMGH
ncbi:Heterogeneous nuclear ribonucleoprotein 1 [Platanthera guangdongensis]|uniref:Heterogeneous nuclear ribonucleoprotein 1 n=1 Tax=Platanthera guangdongensis TaxID=2320717 RepID=A0ABR2MAT4_9ASPA